MTINLDPTQNHFFTLICLATYLSYIFKNFLYSINNSNRFFSLHKDKESPEHPLHPTLFLRTHSPKKIYTQTLSFYIQVLD